MPHVSASKRLTREDADARYLDWIRERYDLYRTADYLDGFRPQIEHLLRLAKKRDSGIPVDVQFMLAVLTIDADRRQEMNREAREGQLWTVEQNIAQASGYAPEGQEPDEFRKHRLADGRKALETVHKAAVALLKRIDRYQTIFENQKEKLPLYHRNRLPRDIRRLRGVLDEHVYLTEAERLRATVAKISPFTAENLALFWWCYYFPFKTAGLEELYSLAVTWKLTRARARSTFVSHLHRVTRETKSKDSINASLLWFQPPRLPLCRIHLPFSESVVD